MKQQDQRTTNPNVKAPPVFVDVRAERDGGKVTFSHDWRFGENGPSQGKGTIDLPPGSGETEIQFHLHTEGGLKLAFLKTPEDAMWVEKVPDPDPGNKCPPGPGDGGQIDFAKSEAHPRLLKICDLNTEDCLLRYGLRFQGDNGVELYDPMIRNGGGTFF